MKSFRSSLIAVLVFLLAMAHGSAEKVATMPAPTGYVDDFAAVMTPAGKAEIDAICHEVHEKTKAQIFFVTVKSLEGESVETFANDLFHKWKIGEKKTDRGILVLLAIDDHKRRIEVGYGLEGILPDTKAGDIGRQMTPALEKASDYDEAALVSVRALASVIADDAKVSLDSTEATTPALSDQPPVTSAPPSSEVHSIPAWLAALPFVGFFVLFGILVWISIRRRQRSGYISGPGYYDSDSSSSFSSGGSDSSSSSDSFSGGDGGDSGGGGASGDW